MSELPSLKFKYGDLEPFIDEATMRLHHLKHHQGYVDKLNAALEAYPDLAARPVADLLRDLDQVPEAIRPAVRNQGGGHDNHSRFWEMLHAPGLQPGEKTIGALDQFFGGLEHFQKQFAERALGHFGSGWCWLVADGGRLQIVTTANQDSPLSAGQTIILGLDVWEHAYYLKYQNRRAEYIQAFFQVVNWSAVESALAAIALK